VTCPHCGAQWDVVFSHATRPPRRRDIGVCEHCGGALFIEAVDQVRALTVDEWNALPLTVRVELGAAQRHARAGRN